MIELGASYWKFVPALNSLPSTFLLWTSLSLIIFISLNFLQEFILDFLTVSIQFTLSITDAPDVTFPRLVFDYISKFAGEEQDPPLFHTLAHVTPRFSKKENEENDDGTEITTVKGFPNYGTTFFKYRRVWFRVVCRVGPNGQAAKFSVFHVKLSVFKWKKEVLESFIHAAVAAHYALKRKKKTVIYGIDQHFSWVTLGNPKPSRSVASIFLANRQVETIIRDLNQFLRSRKWYEEMGVPYHRGYLLHGPPGSGKTSTVKALAGHFKTGISTVSLCSEELDDDSLIYHLSKAPTCFILIEDVDCAFKPRQYGMDPTQETNVALAGLTGSSVTFRGLLNALDGVASSEGKIVFFTTNHPEKLDPALLRPGRVDVKLFLDYPDEKMLGRYFVKFYPEATEKLKQKFLSTIKFSGDRKVSIAMVQGLFMLYKENALEAIDGAKEYLEEQFKILPKLNNPNPNLYL